MTIKATNDSKLSQSTNVLLAPKRSTKRICSSVYRSV